MGGGKTSPTLYVPPQLRRFERIGFCTRISILLGEVEISPYELSRHQGGMLASIKGASWGPNVRGSLSVLTPFTLLSCFLRTMPIEASSTNESVA